MWIITIEYRLTLEDLLRFNGTVGYRLKFGIHYFHCFDQNCSLIGFYGLYLKKCYHVFIFVSINGNSFYTLIGICY